MYYVVILKPVHSNVQLSQFQMSLSAQHQAGSQSVHASCTTSWPSVNTRHCSCSTASHRRLRIPAGCLVLPVCVKRSLSACPSAVENYSRTVGTWRTVGTSAEEAVIGEAGLGLKIILNSLQLNAVINPRNVTFYVSQDIFPFYCQY